MTHLRPSSLLSGLFWPPRAHRGKAWTVPGQVAALMGVQAWEASWSFRSWLWLSPGTLRLQPWLRMPWVTSLMTLVPTCSF